MTEPTDITEPTHPAHEPAVTDGQAPAAPASGAATEAIAATQVAARAAAAKRGKNVIAFDVSQHLAITDVFLVVSASNERQVGAIVDAIEEALLKAPERRKPTRREGDRENRWVLLDYIDIVVHVQHDEERELYSLERLWRDCPRIELDLDDVEAEPEPDTMDDEQARAWGWGTPQH